MKQTAIVIGAGIAGLGTARALALKGYSVTVIERTHKAIGASIRNFGMLWPVGQPDGKLYERAIRSREIWQDIAERAGLGYEACGSLHVAYHADEWAVLQELYELFNASGRPVELLDSASITRRFNAVQPRDLLGGLFSATEAIIDPRAAIAGVPAYLEQQLAIKFIWGKNVTAVMHGKVMMGKEIMAADLVCICSGADFETLYPDAFAALQITKCKLQMLRFAPPQGSSRIGTALCGGLSLIHYQGFSEAASLPLLKERYQAEMSEYLRYGIHVMVAQNQLGELTVGDSHEYGLTFDPFDSAHINSLIIAYLGRFVQCTDWKLVQTWNGIYPKMLNGDTDLFLSPEPGVFIINGFGGAGMTLSFGFAEEITKRI